VTLFGRRFTKGDAIVVWVLLFALYLVIIGIVIYAGMSAIDGDEHVNLAHDPLFRVWMEGCVADGLDPLESCLAWIDYLHGPPILVKPSRTC
jgi:hypothetical protein